MKPRISASRLILRNHLFEITFRISSPFSQRFRRQIAVEIFRQISPTIRMISESVVRHDDGYFSTRIPEHGEDIGLKSSSQSPNLHGLNWRFRRLKAGLTLRESAKQAGINYGQLSRIERGMDSPSPKTVMKMMEFFSRIEGKNPQAESK